MRIDTERIDEIIIFFMLENNVIQDLNCLIFVDVEKITNHFFFFILARTFIRCVASAYYCRVLKFSNKLKIKKHLIIKIKNILIK